jgi:hypothetical protein
MRKLLILKRHRLRRGHRWQFVHDRTEPGVGFGLEGAMPGRCDEIVDPVIAGAAQGPHEGFCLVKMAHPVVTPMHDIDRDVPQSGHMVENVVVVAVGLAVGIEKPAIDHVVDQDPGGGQGVFLVWLAVTVFIAVEAAGAAFPGYAGRCGFRQALPFRLSLRRRGKYLGQPLGDIAAVFRRYGVDEVPPRRREIQIGARHRHGEGVCREFSGIALKEIIDIRSAAQKDAAQDQSLHGCGVCDGIGQREGAAPAATEDVHLAVDVQLMAQRRNIVDQVSGRIVGERRCCVIFARAGCALAAAALVEQDDAVPLRIKKPGGRAVATRTRSAMHDHHGLAGERPVFLPIDSMVGKSRRGQMAGPDEGRVRRPVCARIVWRSCVGDCIHGVDFCDNGRRVASAGRRQPAGHLTPKSQAVSFN